MRNEERIILFELLYETHIMLAGGGESNAHVVERATEFFLQIY